MRTARDSGNATVYFEKGDLIDFVFECDGEGVYSFAEFMIFAMCE